MQNDASGRLKNRPMKWSLRSMCLPRQNKKNNNNAISQSLINIELLCLIYKSSITW